MENLNFFFPHLVYHFQGEIFLADYLHRVQLHMSKRFHLNRSKKELLDGLTDIDIHTEMPEILSGMIALNNRWDNNQRMTTENNMVD